MRTFKVVSTDGILEREYITAGVEYQLGSITDTVYYCRTGGVISCSFMRTSKFKQALREGSIIFTN